MSRHQEKKFERAEERRVDSSRGVQEVRAGMDTGHGDPALNFQPTDATLIRTAVGGSPPDAADSGTPMQSATNTSAENASTIQEEAGDGDEENISPVAGMAERVFAHVVEPMLPADPGSRARLLQDLHARIEA